MCKVPLEQFVDEIYRLRRDQLAVFVCSRNTVDPKRIQRQKFIVSKRIEEDRAAKPRVTAQSDVVAEECSELRLIRPSLMPVGRPPLRVCECFRNRDGRNDGGSRYRH